MPISGFRLKPGGSPGLVRGGAAGLTVAVVFSLATVLLFVSASACLGPGRAVVAVALPQERVTLALGHELKLAVQASLGNGETRDVSGSGSGTTYRSSNPEVATVDAGGVIRLAEGAVSGETARVTATHAGFSTSVEVLVKNVLSATVAAAGDGTPMVTNYAGVDAVVNKQRNLAPAYVPEDLVVPDVRFSFSEQAEKRYLREAAARALERLFAAATADGIELVAVSGYRSYETQERIFQRNVALYGVEQASRFSARPGQSEHQTGLAMDVSCAAAGYRLEEAFGTTPEGRWLAQNAASFGFIVRYPEGSEELTGYTYEPWHIRYVGEVVALEITALGLTMEEYFVG